MLPKTERFWILFIMRFAFGFLFLFAAANIFNYGADKFVADLAKPFVNTWVWQIEGGQFFVEKSLIVTPYLLGALSIPILTGIFLRPALRLGALTLVCLGLGKYLQNDIATTAFDFMLAFMICVGLYMVGRETPANESAQEYGA